jgi:sugar phosphate isomerase/epimerase
MNCKGVFPFRLGCTSYVLPDEILPNVEFLADRVDDVELVLFESPDASNLPGKEVVASMQHIAISNDITFSVHFPIDRRAGSPDAGERRKFLESAIEIIRLTKPLPVSGYLLHLEGLDDENNLHAVKRWSEAVGEFCDGFAAAVDIDPRLICVENLAYAPDLHQQLVDKYRYSHCIDVGHLWLYGADWRSYVCQVLENTRIIHLHGVAGGKDHLSLSAHTQQMDLQELISMLKNYTGTLTLEVFGMDDTFTSLARFEELWRQLP